MDITEEEFLTDETDTQQEEAFKETYPMPWEDTVREFQDYLLDIGVRI